MVTFANLGDKSPADGFDTQPVASALNMKSSQTKLKAPETSPAPSAVDLDSILN